MLKNLGRKPNEINYGSTRDVGVTTEWDIYIVPDNYRGDITIPPGVQIKYAVSLGSDRKCLVATGLLSPDAAQTLLESIPVTEKFKKWTMIADISQGAFIYQSDGAAVSIPGVQRTREPTERSIIWSLY